MKRILLVFAMAFAAMSAMAQAPFTVGSYNIRYENTGDAERGNAWDVRSKAIFDLLEYEGWDIFGAQEVLVDQLHDILDNVEGYDYIGVAREDGKEDGEFAPIFYRKDRMNCLDKGWFWISETPDVVGSIGWDADQTRICTWGYFEDDETKWKFWFFNLHMDHRGVAARREGAKLVLAKIKEMCGNDPYILTGDFNVDQNNEAYKMLIDSGMFVDTYDSAKHKMAQTGTTNSFRADHWTASRIDHILVSPLFRTHRYGVLTYDYWTQVEGQTTERGRPLYQARMLSDHYPVAACVELPRLRSPKDWADYRCYAKQNSEIKKTPKVVFMGDSITENWYENHPHFFDDNNYAGRGISGQVTAQMLARFRADVIDLNPETVVILAGTNDIAMNQGYVPLDYIYGNIVSMAEIAKANGIKVVLCSILPADGYSWSWEVSRERAINSILELNSKIKAYAKKNKMKYADYFAAMADENNAMIKEYQNDAVHPNAAGYVVMEEVIQKILKK